MAMIIYLEKAYKNTILETTLKHLKLNIDNTLVILNKLYHLTQLNRIRIGTLNATTIFADSKVIGNY